MLIKMTKLSDSEQAEYKNHIETGKEVVGIISCLPVVGESFWVGNNYRTSTVKELISPTKFRTNNSIYEIKLYES